MTEQTLIEFLKTTELLCEIPLRDLSAIAEQLERVELASGDTLFSEGDIGDAAYLIVEGQMAMVSDGVELVRRGRGGCVGEFALLDDEPRSATVVARTPLKLLRWRREHFLGALTHGAPMARGLVRMLTRKLRSDIERGVDLLIERERWQQDLARSREIQSGMLPPEHIQLGSLDIAGRCTPAADVGGDFYDFIEFTDSEVGLAIGDVTGHGFYSGLFVAMAKSCLHTQARFDHAPIAVMSAMRQAMELSLERRMLMTCSYLVVDTRAQRLRYANAGHPHPLRWRSCERDVVKLPVLDPILGALDVDEGEFHAREEDFLSGDVLLLYSDGITESRSPDGELFGVTRLSEVFAANVDKPSHELRDAVLAAAVSHADGAAQLDDLTLLVVRHIGGGG